MGKFLQTSFSAFEKTYESASKPSPFKGKPAATAVFEVVGGLSKVTKETMNELEYNTTFKAFTPEMLPALVDDVNLKIGYPREPIGEQVLQDVKQGVLLFNDITVDDLGPELGAWWSGLTMASLDFVRRGPVFVLDFRTGQDPPKQ